MPICWQLLGGLKSQKFFWSAIKENDKNVVAAAASVAALAAATIFYIVVAVIVPPLVVVMKHVNYLETPSHAKYVLEEDGEKTVEEKTKKIIGKF